MERRRSLPRAAAAAAAAGHVSSPLSDHNTSPLRRKSISFAPYNSKHDDDSPNSPAHPSSFLRPPNSPLHRTSNSSSPSVPNRKSTTESPRRLHTQRSSDDLQTPVLWPSSKKLNPSADNDADVASEPLARHLDHDHDRRIDAATYNVSTFSSRQRVVSFSDQTAAALEDRKGDRGSRSLRYHIGKLHVERSLKKPGTPPSPTSSTSSSTTTTGPLPPSAQMLPGRFSFREVGLPRKTSDFLVDFPSAESERSENVGPSPRISRGRRPESPVKHPGSPVKGRSGGVGSFISQGFNNLFRRKSFHGVNGESVTKPMVNAAAGVGSPGRDRAAKVKGMGSPGRETNVTARANGSPSRGAAVAVVDGELQHKLRILHNYLIQWRFVNAGTVVVTKIKCGNAQRTLVNAWLGLSDRRILVAKNRAQLEKEKLKFKLNKLLYHQTEGLERWGTMERQHLAALSSTKDSLQAAVCKLPVTDHAKVDPHSLSPSLQQATNLAAEINGNIAKYHSRAQSTAPLVAELAQVVAREKPILEECIELLGLVSTLQVHEESLRSHIIQLKSQQLIRCTAKEPSS